MSAMASQNHRRLDCLLNRLFRRRSRKTSKLCITGLYEGNSLVTGEFPAQRASNAENVSIWWRHHEITLHNWYDHYLEHAQGRILQTVYELTTKIIKKQKQIRASIIRVGHNYANNTVVTCAIFYPGE